MSRVQSRDDRNGRWFYDKAEIEQTPSRRDGIDKFHELQYRQRAASLIQVFHTDGVELSYNGFYEDISISRMNSNGTYRYES